MKILNIYGIREKLFGVVTNNTSNNGIIKDELKKAMARRDFRWDKV